MKTCLRCREDKALTEFYRDSRNGDGLQRRCKGCHVDANRESRRHNAEKYRERARGEYAANPGRPTKRVRPEQKKANNLLNRAVRRGDVARPAECSACGATDTKIHAHHDDYAAPLEVRWLCTWCHGAEHSRLKAMTA